MTQSEIYNFDCTCFTEGLNGFNECVDVYGGIDEVYILPKCNLEGLEVNNGEVTGITISASFSQYNFRQDAAEFTIAPAIDFEAGTTLFETTLAVSFHGMTVVKRNELMLLTQGQQELIYIFKDNIGTYWIVGAQLNDKRGVRVQSVGGGTGRLRTDANRFEIELFGQLKQLPYVIDESVVNGII
jgi:hypothetical protein